MTRRAARAAAQDQELLAALRAHARLAKARRDPAVLACVVAQDRLRFDPAYRLGRLVMVDAA